MPDTEKVLKAWDRCRVCEPCMIASPEGRKAYLDCEYTQGLYCRRDRLIDETIEILKNQPEIVRCKDCKHGRQYDTNAVDCEYRELATEPDWFCADGELK